MHLPSPPVIALLTDFGLRDPYVGIMKGVIASISPQANVIDITHAVIPQNIRHGALLLAASSPWFAEGTIFVAVVDPGVGSSRRPIALETDRGTFIAPDNGVLSIVMRQHAPVSCHHITNPEVMLPSPGATFHGRDIFSPAAAHLAAGRTIGELGPKIDPGSCTRTGFPEPHIGRQGSHIRGEVLYSDIYGNLVTSIECSLIEGHPEQWQVEAGTQVLQNIRRTYSDVAEGEPLAYCGSSGYLEIAVRNGSAAAQLDLDAGDAVTLLRREGGMNSPGH
ncbi:SAM-dependent chlorinase/fluorinase [Prosthecochloris sp. N3]|uniref:SAM-dependent chlorinase/fluorinase n=1 Tax=Prosthecochloris ethylica TaxID=2743976 RepID=A0ABR9XNX1_9CHLB|nr:MULTISPECIES: SAM-dependent chlorinase/fluorinase [Prosthecochloris]MBF0585657.1 SAM-dependent chlorinase/fluorinase [Prosthecochloris ethylica]MBF0635567.1 SAM-dependent chlorinase/fluorinase [Prosthecochloris ethylica]NUK46866.1 SAM-dependent chlorinase/fluorinase [Prosthecochloris ethylica]RNA65370.1 hypothetical protein CR163_009175 [Prosthecochloris sp. ZM_2]